MYTCSRVHPHALSATLRFLFPQRRLAEKESDRSLNMNPVTAALLIDPDSYCCVITKGRGNNSARFPKAANLRIAFWQCVSRRPSGDPSNSFIADAETMLNLREGKDIIGAFIPPYSTLVAVYHACNHVRC